MLLVLDNHPYLSRIEGNLDININRHYYPVTNNSPIQIKSVYNYQEYQRSSHKSSLFIDRRHQVIAKTWKSNQGKSAPSRPVCHLVLQLLLLRRFWGRCARPIRKFGARCQSFSVNILFIIISTLLLHYCYPPTYRIFQSPILYFKTHT